MESYFSLNSANKNQQARRFYWAKLYWQPGFSLFRQIMDVWQEHITTNFTVKKCILFPNVSLQYMIYSRITASSLPKQKTQLSPREHSLWEVDTWIFLSSFK